MTKNTLQVNSHKFLGTHFHTVNELVRFFENAVSTKNSSHHFISLVSPMLFAVVAMNDSFLRFTMNETLIESLRAISEYYNKTLHLLDEIYPECNEETKDDRYFYFKEEAEKIYKKTVSDLNRAIATNFIERLHIRQLIIILTSIRNITLLKMQIDDCNRLTPLLCDLDITTKTYLRQLEKMLRF